MENGVGITSRQIRAARALLDWSQENLANAAGLSIATIRKLEVGHISPRDVTAQNIRKAFEDNDLEFLEPNGVRYRSHEIIIHHGTEGIPDFFDDVHQTIRRKNGEIAICASEDFFNMNIDCYEDFIARMAAIKSRVSLKHLSKETSSTLSTMGFCECRSLSEHYVDLAPLCIYGNKYAIFETGPVPKIIVIQSPVISQSMRRQFYSMWDKAMPIGQCVNVAERLVA